MFWGLFEPPCSWWFNRWPGGRDWRHCCAAHDRDYDRFELAYDRAAFRLMADQELRDCVNAVLPGMGAIMYVGVRLFGALAMRARR